MIIESLEKLGQFLTQYLTKSPEFFTQEEKEFSAAIRQATFENKWFTEENILYSLSQWAEALEKENLHTFLQNYTLPESTGKKQNLGLILAGNIPLVGLHDIFCALLSGWSISIKSSSKDDILPKAILNLLAARYSKNLPYEFVDRLTDYDAVIATGSNNTASYFEYYFKHVPHIIRKNRTSVAVISGNESHEELQLLGNDVFTYFGLGCRNVTKLFLPESFLLPNLVSAWEKYKKVVMHSGYANNYEYQRALAVLNKEDYYDGEFVLLIKKDTLHAPPACLYFSVYRDPQEVVDYISENKESIQCISGSADFLEYKIPFGKCQQPQWNDFADGVDTLKFLLEN